MALEALDATSWASAPLQGLSCGADMLAATRPPFSAIGVLSNGSDEMTEASAAQIGRAPGESRARVYSTVHRCGVGDRTNPDLLLEFLEPADAGQTDDVRVGVLQPGALVRGLGITPPEAWQASSGRPRPA